MKPIIAEPEFCPNKDCRFHDRHCAGEQQWYILFGTFGTLCRGTIQRFRCLHCGKTCSTQTFSVHYWTHSTNDLSWLLEHLYGCSGLRQSGRFAGVSYRLIQNRTRRLARNALAVMDVALAGHIISENLTADGFESYTRSQYHPNNITFAAGSRSQFIYAAVHTLLRRKGAMTEAQKRTRALIDLAYRPASSIKGDCRQLFADLTPLITTGCHSRSGLELATDCHQAYRPALHAVESLAAHLSAATLRHLQVSSRAARTTANPLFAVNYVDRQLRKNLAEYVRETVRQGREVNCQMERFAVFMLLHNFCTPHRIGDRVRYDWRPTHAEVAGIGGADLKWQFDRMLTHRHLWSHHLRDQQWIRRIWLHRYANPPVVRLGADGVLKRGKVALGQGQLAAHFLA